MVEKTLEEKMTDELNQAIQEAEKASAAQREADEIAEKAKSLDGLRRQKAETQAIQTAEALLEETSALVTAKLLRVQPEVNLWKQNYKHVVAEIEELIKALPLIQKEIVTSGLTLQRVSQDLYYKSHPGKNPLDPDNDIPAILSGANDFDSEWQAVGGASENLDVFPPMPASGVSFELAGLIRKISKVMVYSPKAGTRLFRKHG
jgi:hypothetical protein